MEFNKEIEAILYSDLLLKSLQGKTSSAEEEKLRLWLDSSKKNEAIHHELFSQESRSIAYADYIRYTGNNEFKPNNKRVNKKPFKLWHKITAAAAVILIISFLAIIFFNNNDRSNSLAFSKPEYDLNPGKSKATLVLANGKVVSLSSNQTAIVIKANQFLYEDGSSINDSIAGTNGFQTINTPNSGFYQVILSDGTKVYLNSASSLRFPAKFSNKERKVKVTGEAYFEVAKVFNSRSKSRIPFIVETASQNIEVLGTHFNVNNYDSSTKTTLLEGSVKVQSIDTQNSQKSIILIPGQQSILNHDNFQVKVVDTDAAVSWKKGYFNFDEETLGNIMDQVSRWYDVKVDFQNEKLKLETFSGIIQRNIKASELLKMLEKAGDVKFSIEEDKITVMSK